MTKSEQVCALSGDPSAGAIYPSRVDYYALRCKPLIYFMKGIRRQNESRAVPPLDMGEKIPSVGALCDLGRNHTHTPFYDAHEGDTSPRSP